MAERVRKTSYLVCQEGAGSPEYQRKYEKFLKERQAALEAGRIMQFLEERKVATMFPLIPDVYILSKHENYDEADEEVSKRKPEFEKDGFSLGVYEVDADISIERTVRRIDRKEGGVLIGQTVDGTIYTNNIDMELGVLILS